QIIINTSNHSNSHLSIPYLELRPFATSLNMKPATLLFFAANSLGLVSAASIGSPDDGALALDGVLNAVEKRASSKSGANFSSDQNEALKAARTACNGPLTKGTYQKRETRIRCYNIAKNKQVKLTVGLPGSNAPSSRK